MIKENFEITLKEIRKPQDEIKDLRKEISEFKVNLEFTKKELHDKMKKLREKHESINKAVDEIYVFQMNSVIVYDKLINLKDRSRRNNLRIYGMKHGRRAKNRLMEYFVKN